jgi:hypothetical protein
MLRTFYAPLPDRCEVLLRPGINLMLGFRYSVDGWPAIDVPRSGIECTVCGEISEELLN